MKKDWYLLKQFQLTTITHQLMKLCIRMKLLIDLRRWRMVSWKLMLLLMRSKFRGCLEEKRYVYLSATFLAIYFLAFSLLCLEYGILSLQKRQLYFRYLGRSFMLGLNQAFTVHQLCGEDGLHVYLRLSRQLISEVHRYQTRKEHQWMFQPLLTIL